MIGWLPSSNCAQGIHDESTDSSSKTFWQRPGGARDWNVECPRNKLSNADLADGRNEWTTISILF
jgi:hypothetical protein